MEFLNWLSCKLLGEKVGYDSHGNSYFKSSYLARVLRKEKRWVRYNGIPEFTKVPTSWYAWLHHQTNLIPQTEKSFTWQEDRQMNMTGTKQAYKPKHKSSQNSVTPHIWSPKTIKS
jgi:NADH:ubiquinone oxidoreductase subunit